MQTEGQNRDEPISGRGGFSSHRGMLSSIFGGRDPFDDPFFNRPFKNMLEPSIVHTRGALDDFPHPNTSNSMGLVIEELDTDDEPEGRNNHSGKGPLIEHPDDEGTLIQLLSCASFAVGNQYFILLII